MNQEAKPKQGLSKISSLRGMHDLLPEAMRRHKLIEKTAEETASLYGFEAMGTPILEPLDVFARTLGETSDVVSKEMYSFSDKSGEMVTLRPENTASVVRAFANNGLAMHVPIKFFYAGPMFRYERPQKGRLRQFHQFGIELIGPASPQADIEVIACGAMILDRLGIDQGISLHLNSLGNTISRHHYRTALMTYFQDHFDDLSQDSKDRLTRNPLRILDSKAEGDQVLIANAPKFADYLDQESSDFFAIVQQGLSALNIPFTLNQALVRGLDYYCHTAFEFVSTNLGAQGAVLGGGRYDGLAEFMGFPAIPAVGFAAGIERLAMLIAEPPSVLRPIFIIPMGDSAQIPALLLADQLRKSGLKSEMGYSGNLTKRLKQASKQNARYALILGEDEIAAGAVQLRDLDQSSQALIPLNQLPAHLKSLNNR